MRFLFLFLAPCAFLAAEDSIPVVVPSDAPWWASIIVSIVVLIVVPFVTNYLKKAADAERASLERLVAGSKERALAALKVYAFERAESYVERDFLVLAKMITTGEIKDSAAIKAWLRSLGDRLRTDLIVYAKEQYGVDLLRQYGEKVIGEIIEFAANKVSPFPGKDTAVTLLTGGAEALLARGVRAANDYLNEATP